MKHDLGSIELYIEMHMYMPLEVKGKFVSKMGRSHSMSPSTCQQCIS